MGSIPISPPVGFQAISISDAKREAHNKATHHFWNRYPFLLIKGKTAPMHLGHVNPET